MTSTTPTAARLDEIEQHLTGDYISYDQAVDELRWMHRILTRLGDEKVIEAMAEQIIYSLEHSRRDRLVANSRQAAEKAARAALSAAVARASQPEGEKDA